MTDFINSNKVYINGPINTIRLSGKVYNINKVIYFFMDYPTDIKMQTKCKNVFAKNIQYYLAKSLFNLDTNKIYDFFCEVEPKYNENDNLREIYSQEVFKLFRKIFNYDSNIYKSFTSKYFKNIRLHYLDINILTKNYIKINDNLTKLNFGISKNLGTPITMVNKDIIPQLNDVIKLIKDFISDYNFIIDIVKNSEADDEKRTLINKLLYDYNDVNIKNILNNLINELIEMAKKNVRIINKNINEFEKYKTILNIKPDELVYNKRLGIYFYGPDYFEVNKILFDITINVMKIQKNHRIFFSNFVDLYLLRRFLDKDYINQSIVYTNVEHVKNCIYILIKYFDFKITHISYSKYDIDILNDKIKNIKNLDEINEFIYPKFFEQCSNVTDFPKKFL